MAELTIHGIQFGGSLKKAAFEERLQETFEAKILVTVIGMTAEEKKRKSKDEDDMTGYHPGLYWWELLQPDSILYTRDESSLIR